MGGHGSGGARIGSGHKPDPQALARHRDGKDWTHLPACGRLGEPPEWPDETIEPNEDELLMWRRVWTSPQALVWEADQVFDLVAFYVRTYLEGMKPRAGAQARTFVRQLSTDLLLTPGSLFAARYVVDESPEAMAIEAAMATHPAGKAIGRPKKSARERFTVVRPEPPADEGEPEVEAVAEEPESEEPPF